MEYENKKGQTTVKNNIYMLKLIWTIQPQRVIFCAICNILISLKWVFTSIIFIKYIFDNLDNKSNFHEIFIFISLSMLFYLMVSAYSCWYNFEFVPLSDNLIYSSLTKIIIDKAMNVELSCYESADFYNKYILALNEIENRFKSVLNNIFGIMTQLVSVIYVIYTIFLIDKFVAIFAIFPLIGNFAIGKVINSNNFKRDIEMTPYNRKRDYVNRVMYLTEYAKEMRQTKMLNIINKIFDEGYDGIISTIHKYYKKNFLFQIIQSILNFNVVFEGVLVYSAFRTMVSHTMQIGEFTILSSAMVSTTWIIINLSNNILEINNNGLFIYNFRSFLDYEEKIPENQKGIIPHKDIYRIEFKNVSFTYKYQCKPTIDKLSFVVDAGEKVVLVGTNGSGKTTLMKLLMRLYDPDEGTILINDIDIREYDVCELRRLFGATFQDYQIFSMSVKDNILMSNNKYGNQREKVISALKFSGGYERMLKLDNGIETMLTREFDDDGTILSGGENQKIAIARAFAKDANIIIFDEPSSALDPIAEFILYNNIKLYSFNKITFYITHRLSTATSANKILYLENGRLSEIGDHNTLMNSKGKYWDMFMKQAENYIGEK